MFVLLRPSEIDSVPVLPPVETTSVALVAELIVCETLLTPETPDNVNVVPTPQEVPVPASDRVTVLSLYGIADGDAEINSPPEIIGTVMAGVNICHGLYANDCASLAVKARL